MECGSLNVVGPHNFKGSGTIRRYDYAGISIALLKEVCHCQGGF